MEMLNLATAKTSEALVKVPPLTKGLYLLDVLEIDGKPVTREMQVRINPSMERFLSKLEEGSPERAKAGFNLVIRREGTGIHTKYLYEVA